MNRKSMAALIALVVALAMSVSAASFAPGTYEAQANGNNAEVRVEVVLSDSAIEQVTVTGHAETPGISDAALERIPAAIVGGQTLAVDAVTGATNTSAAIVNAVEDCLRQAGADTDALKVPAEREAPGEVSERSVQVLVIGAGGSGMAAATTLLEGGAQVLLIDKAATPGGATALTGALTAGGMSRLQAERGGTDDVNTIFLDLMRYGDYENDARMTRLFAENMGPSVDWLHEVVGVEYEPLLSFFPEHTNDRALYPLGKKAGYLTGTQAEHYKEIGGELLLDTKATELLFEDGRVAGAKCETADGTLIIRADATLLATGGYGASVALRPEKLDSVLFYGASTSMGEGILMAQKVGAMTHYMDYLKCYPQGIEKPLEGGNISADGTTYRANAYISPLASQAATMNDGAIYVNLAGERCMNENLDFVSIKKATVQQDGIEVFLLLNQQGFENWMASMATSSPLTMETVEPWLEGEGYPVLRKGATLDEVASRAGVDAEGLKATVAHFNEMVKTGVDADFGREQMAVELKEDGAWYLIEQRLRMATSLGGLKTSLNFEVLDINETPIPGLYACGETIGGVHGTESMPSCMVGWAITSGRLSAQAIALALDVEADAAA